MESVVQPVPANYRRRPLPEKVSGLHIAVLAPPLVEPFQPSLSLPYLAAQMGKLGKELACYNLSNLFYFSLFWGRMRFEATPVDPSLREATQVLRSESAFYDPAAYQGALQTLEQFLAAMAERDALPYTLFPGSNASAVVDSGDYRTAVQAMEGTLLDRFLQDFMRRSLEREVFDVIGLSATNAFQLATSLYVLPFRRCLCI